MVLEVEDGGAAGVVGAPVRDVADCRERMSDAEPLTRMVGVHLLPWKFGSSQ